MFSRWTNWFFSRFKSEKKVIEINEAVQVKEKIITPKEIAQQELKKKVNQLISVEAFDILKKIINKGYVLDEKQVSNYNKKLLLSLFRKDFDNALLYLEGNKDIHNEVLAKYIVYILKGGKNQKSINYYGVRPDSTFNDMYEEFLKKEKLVKLFFEKLKEKIIINEDIKSLVLSNVREEVLYALDFENRSFKWIYKKTYIDKTKEQEQAFTFNYNNTNNALFLLNTFSQCFIPEIVNISSRSELIGFLKSITPNLKKYENEIQVFIDSPLSFEFNEVLNHNLFFMPKGFKGDESYYNNSLRFKEILKNIDPYYNNYLENIKNTINDNYKEQKENYIKKIQATINNEDIMPILNKIKLKNYDFTVIPIEIRDILKKIQYNYNYCYKNEKIQSNQENKINLDKFYDNYIPSILEQYLSISDSKENLIFEGKKLAIQLLSEINTKIEEIIDEVNNVKLRDLSVINRVLKTK